MALIRINQDNRLVFWLLIIGIAVNLIWSFRLDLQAKTTANRVEAFHFNLKQNSDILLELREFLRRADEISIKTNNQKLALEMMTDRDRLDIYAPGNGISMGALGKTGNGLHFFSNGSDGSSNLLQSSSGFRFDLGEGSQPFHFKMGRAKNLIQMRHQDSFVELGNVPTDTGSYQGVFLGEKNNATIGINKEEGIGMISVKKILLHLATATENEPFHLKMDRDKELIQLRHRDSFVEVGNVPTDKGVYQGVFLGEKNNATIGINEAEGIGIRSKKKIYINSKGDLILEADGDIKIQSIHGEVQISGKKIHLNK